VSESVGLIDGVLVSVSVPVGVTVEVDV